MKFFKAILGLAAGVGIIYAVVKNFGKIKGFFVGMLPKKTESK